VVKASRRAIFRGFFRRSSFELDQVTANEILMRINQSLDPQSLTDGMWATYAAARRRLHYAKYDDAGEPRAEGGVELDGPAGVPDFRELSDSVAKDLAFLLRIETLMRRWIALGDAPADASRQMRDQVSSEVHHYLDDCEKTERYQRDVVDPILRCLASAAGVQLPPEGSASE
jgi:hypothetical protein